MDKEKSWITRNKYNLLYYLGGFFLLGFAVNLGKASRLGNGAWDTVTINIRDYFLNVHNYTWITLGMVSFTISMILMLIVMIYRRKIKYLTMLIPIGLIAISIDFWNIFVFQDQTSSTFEIQLLFYISAALLLPLGLTMVVKSGFPAFVYDELMLMFVKVFKAKKITWVRLGIEMTGILIGVIFGYLVYIHFFNEGHLGAVNVGSFILAFTLSPVMAYYYKVLKIPKEKDSEI